MTSDQSNSETRSQKSETIQNRGAKVGLHRAGLLTPTRYLELRARSAYHKHVILRSPPFLLADDEPAAAGPQFAGHIHPSDDGPAIQTNYRDSSSANKNGGLRMTVSA